MRLVFVSREVYPFVGGGIAPIVSATAQALGDIAEMTIVTSAANRPLYESLRRQGDDRLPQDVRFLFADEPEEVGGFFSYMHAYSAGVLDVLRCAYPRRGPDLIEFADYLGEGLVTVQAKRGGEARFLDTLVCVRAHTTSEFCAVLDGHLPQDFATEAVHDAERYVLQHADVLLWPGGDVLGTYQRFYGAGRLAPHVCIPDGFLDRGSQQGETGVPNDLEAGPLRILFLGRMERRKGVQNLIRAVGILEEEDWTLSLLGGDTNTAPLEGSMRAQLELMAEGDARVAFLDPVDRDEVAKVIREHHVVAIPSLWECWPNVGREALMQNRPILATPVGGLPAMARQGQGGWLTSDVSPRSLAETLDWLIGDRSQVADLISRQAPVVMGRALTDPEQLRSRYAALVGRERRAVGRGRRGRGPLVSVVVPYFELEEHVEQTIRSIAEQSYPNVEAIIVNDGSLRHEDRLLEALARRWGVKLITQPNSGLGAARNRGVRASRGRYVLPLDADDWIAPEFVERCVDVLERQPEVAYCTTWSSYVYEDARAATGSDDGYMPFGNWSRLNERNNVAGSCSAVIRKRFFDLGFSYSTELVSYEDWLLYRELAAAGHYGTVIPERLFFYRVRGDSMTREVGAPRIGRLYDEMNAHMRERSMRWTSKSA